MALRELNNYDNALGAGYHHPAMDAVSDCQLCNSAAHTHVELNFSTDPPSIVFGCERCVQGVSTTPQATGPFVLPCGACTRRIRGVTVYNQTGNVSITEEEEHEKFANEARQTPPCEHCNRLCQQCGLHRHAVTTMCESTPLLCRHCYSETPLVSTMYCEFDGDQDLSD